MDIYCQEEFFFCIYPTAFYTHNITLHYTTLQTEQEAAAQLPEGHSLEDGIYGPIKAAIESILAATSSTGAIGATGMDVASGVVAGGGDTTTLNTTYVAATGDSAEAGELKEETPISTTNTTNNASTESNNYNNLDTIDNYVNNTTTSYPYTTAITYISATADEEERAIDEAGEKQLMSTIEQFRLRQLQRDK